MTATHRHDWVAIYARPKGKYVRVGSICGCGLTDRGLRKPGDLGPTIKGLSMAYDVSVAAVRRAVLKGDLVPMATVDGEMVFGQEEAERWLASR